MTNPFAGFGVPDATGGEISNLVDQAVVLQAALVPKLPEIGITDGMIPIIDQIYADSGSNSVFTPGTTINFNFGNSHGKLVDWTQSRLEFDIETQVTLTNFGAQRQIPGEDAGQYYSSEDIPAIQIEGSKPDPSGGQETNKNVGRTTGILIEENGIFCGLRNGAQAFSQVTFAGFKVTS